ANRGDYQQLRFDGSAAVRDAAEVLDVVSEAYEYTQLTTPIDIVIRDVDTSGSTNNGNFTLNNISGAVPSSAWISFNDLSIGWEKRTNYIVSFTASGPVDIYFPVSPFDELNPALNSDLPTLPVASSGGSTTLYFAGDYSDRIYGNDPDEW